MNIKSLLLGSAAALVAVSGARAADAVVVAEPEPVEYVRVCDVYGAGFFYIPGTETCLRISGEVRYQINLSSEEDGWWKRAKGRVNFDARSETEWGTLRGYIRFDSSWAGYNTVDGPVVVDHAFIELGGLRMGYTESAWAQTQYGGASNWGSHTDTGMNYGYQQRDLIAYSFQGGNGFFGTVSLEDDNLSGDANFMPDVVVKAGMNQGWGAVWAKVAYDEDSSNHTGVPGSDGWAASLGVHVNIPNMAGSSFRLIGFYADSDNDYNHGPFDAYAYRWSLLASYQHAFSSSLNASIGVQYLADNYNWGGDDAWLVQGDIVWTPVTNFTVRVEATHDFYQEVTSGFIRFSRFF
jgi:hypothetical protein